jgi:hypothetical protein
MLTIAGAARVDRTLRPAEMPGVGRRKEAVQRPEANEGGREEEERCPGISVRFPEGLHGLKK